MKLHILIVSVIAVITTNCRDFGGHSHITEPIEDYNSAENSQNITVQPLYSDSTEGNIQVDQKEEKAYNDRNIRSMMESMVDKIVIHLNNTKLDLLHDAMGTKLNTLEIKLNNANTKLDSIFAYLRSNLNDTQSGMSTQETPITTMMATEKTPASAVPCSGEGFFQLEGSGQCFKYINRIHLNWEQAKARCEQEGMMLPEPADNIAAKLRNQLLDKYGSGHCMWVNARYNESSYVWQRNGTSMNKDLLMSSGSNYYECTYMWVTQTFLKPGKPYNPSRCTNAAGMDLLCEVVHGVN